MKFFLVIALFAVGLAGFVDAACTISCGVDGNTLFDGNFIFYNTSLGTNDASVALKSISGTIYAIKDSSHVSDFSGLTNFDYFADRDGNFLITVTGQGTSNDFNLGEKYRSSGNTFYFVDKNCVGTSCGTTKNYTFNVVNSPPLSFDDALFFQPFVKGGQLMSNFAHFKEGHSGGQCGSISPCDFSFTVRQLPSNYAIAHKSYTDWAVGSQNLPLIPSNDGNYVFQIDYQGTWGVYDLNILYNDVNNNLVSKKDTYQYVGASLATGSRTEYFFNVAGSPVVTFDDNKSFSSSVAGQSQVINSIKFRDAQFGGNCGGVSDCDFSIGVRRMSDNKLIAYKKLTAPGDMLLTTIPYYDGQYRTEVWFQGLWSVFDFNATVKDINGATVTHKDQYQYVGSSLGTGDTADYYFSVQNSPSVDFDDGLTLPYKAAKNTLASASIRILEGDGGTPSNCGAISQCDFRVSIRRVSDGNTMATIFTSNWTDWSSTPAALNWTVQNEDEYYLEVWTQGRFGYYDINMNYTDTTNVARHYEDHYKYVGSSLTTGNFVEYYFNSGPSCGNGINCFVEPECVPVVLNGDPIGKIDVVFVGSGFPDLNKFGQTVDDMIDYDGNAYGLMHYSPFKENKDKFNFWKVNTVQTFSGGMVFNEFDDMQWRHNTSYHGEARNAVINNCGSINESKPLFIALLVAPKVRSHAEPNFFDNGSGAAYVTIGTEYFGSCNYLNPPFCAFPSGPIEVQDFTNNDSNFTLAYTRQQVQSTLVHEFGHSFGGLADEYVEDNVSSNFKLSAVLSANCDINFLGNVCSKWSATTSSCVPGCSTSFYYRPFAKSTMYNPDVFEDINFMPVSVNELKKDINSYFENLETASPSSDFSYLVGIINRGSYFDLNGISIIEQKTNPPMPGSGNYKVLIRDVGNNVLYDVNVLVPVGYLYSPSPDWFDSNGVQIFFPDANDYIVDQNFPFSSSFPYFNTGNTLEFLDVNSVIVLTVDISQFKTKIVYSIGYGAGALNNTNFTLEYQLVDQPVGLISSANYICQLGPVPN